MTYKPMLKLIQGIGETRAKLIIARQSFKDAKMKHNVLDKVIEAYDNALTKICEAVREIRENVGKKANLDVEAKGEYFNGYDDCAKEILSEELPAEEELTEALKEGE